jgi:REP element-mobilizing transposase RayT
MPNWKRAHVPGGMYFFTVVTDQRRPLFVSSVARRLLGDVLRECQRQWRFAIRAIVLLPDHLHAIWELPPGDASYSRRWAWTKRQFTKRWLAEIGTETRISAGRRRDGRRGVWQPKSVRPVEPALRHSGLPPCGRPAPATLPACQSGGSFNGLIGRSFSCSARRYH